MDKKIYKSVSEKAEGKCGVCGGYFGERLELHHILRRKVPVTVDNSIMLCASCHRLDQGVHGRDGHELDIKLKLQVQNCYFEIGKTETETRELMGGRLY